MRYKTQHTFTRAEIIAALEAASADVDPMRFYAIRIPFSQDTCLAYDAGSIKDYTAFLGVITEMLPDKYDRRMLHGATEFEGWSNGAKTTYWPGWVLDEMTAEEMLYLTPAEDDDAQMAGAL